MLPPLIHTERNKAGLMSPQSVYRQRADVVQTWRLSMWESSEKARQRKEKPYDSTAKFKSFPLILLINLPLKNNSMSLMYAKYVWSAAGGVTSPYLLHRKMWRNVNLKSRLGSFKPHLQFQIALRLFSCMQELWILTVKFRHSAAASPPKKGFLLNEHVLTTSVIISTDF